MQVPSTSLSKSNTLSDSAFDELLALADAAWAHSNALLPGNDEGMTDQYPSILTSKSYCMDDMLTNPTNKLLSHHHLSSLEQHSIIHEHDNPQGTSCTTCCSITTSQVAPPIPDNGIGAGKKPAQAMQMNMEEKDQGEKMINASAIRIDNNGTPLSKEAQPKRTQKPVSPKPAQSNNGQTEQSMCARRKISPTVVTVVESTKNMMPESAKSCCNRYLNFDKGASNENSADKENATVHPGIEIGVVASEMNAGIACELNSSMKQASNYTSFPNDKKAPGTSSKSNLPGEKPKVIPAAKRKCVRRKGLNKNSTPPTEMTEFTEELPEYAKMSRGRSLNPDIGARDERSAGRKSGVIVQETNFGLAYDLNASVKHASSSFMSFPGGTQAPDISSQRTRPGINPKENPTGKRKYVTRKELKKTSAPPTEVAGEMTTEKMPKFAKPPCKSSMNFDKAEIEESSAVEENATIHLSKEIVVTQEMNPDLAYDVNTSMKQASQSYMSSTEDTQATNTSSRRNPHGAKPKESSTSERKYVRRSALNKSSTLEEGNGAVACYELSLGAEKISNSQDVSVPAATVSDIAGENGKTCEQTTSDNLSGWTDLGSAQYLLSAVTASANSYATQLDNNNGLNDLFIPSVIHDNSGDPHGTSDYACCSKRTSQNTTLAPDNAIKMQINLEEKDRGGEEKDVSSKKLDDDGTPPNKVLCDPVIEFAAVTSPFKENHNPDEESIHYIDLNKTPQQKPKRRKIRPKVIREGKPKRSRQPVTPKPVQSKENPTGKRKYVRKKGLNKTCTPSTEVTGELTEEMPESAKMSCRRSLNFDIGARDDSSAGRENTTALLGKEDDVVIQETNSGLACDLNASVKHASNSFMSLPEDTQAPDTSSQRTRPGTKPKENPHGKRRYATRKEMKNSVPPKEVTGELTTEKRPEFDKGTIEECSVVRENATIHLSKETIVTQEMNPDLAYDVNTSMKQASQSHMSLREDTQPTNTSSRRNPHGAKPKESSTSERKYVRRSALNKSSTPTEVLGELTGEMTPESAKTSCRKSLNFDIGARDESSADRENACKEIGLVMQEMDVGFAYDINISMKQAAANNYMSFPNEQTPSTSPSKNKPPGAKPKENLAGKQEFKEMSRRRSSNSDIGIKDESSACREISDVQIANVVDETPVSLAYNQDTWMEQALNSYRSLPEDTQSPSTYPSKSSLSGAKPKETPTGKRKYVRKKKLNSTATPTEMTGKLTELIMPDSSTRISCGMSLNFDKGGRDESNTCRESLACDQNTSVKEALYNYMSLSENTHAPSTSLPQSSPPGAKLNANPVENKNKRKGLATAQDGNISNSQISTTGLQMVGYKRKHSGTIKCNSSMNLIGAHYNGLPSYESKFQIQFPNIQKKRRTEMRKTSNTHITSSVKKEVPLTCTQEVAKAHPCASNSNCWMYGGSAYNSIIHNAQTFDEFILTLRRVTGSSQPPAQTYDCNSLTRIRNSDTEANYNAKQLGISDWQTFGDADRPQTCIDVLAKEMLSCAKKKRSRKRRALSSSAHSNTNETQQHHNFAWGNHHLPLGKSSDIVHQVIWKSMHNVEALAEQFRQLNINTEARDLVLHVQNALVPFQGSFDPIKKQRPRPKVYLDEETDRVWKLLMLDINHHGIDGTDEDKAKWWEEERNVFRGRADSFIARMHLVQGDRRFSRWKGSVLDSVVGVFLTQNVSDHLSSSAFMSLAARFPKKSSSMCKTYHGEGTSLVVNKQVHIVEPEENTEWDVKLLNQSVYDQSSMTVDLVEHSGEKAVNSDDSCIITTSVISLTDESNSRLSESPQRNIKEHQCPMVMIEEGEEKSCHDGARKELNGIVSSQCSVISSQLSGDFSNDQNPEKIGSCSDSNSEVEDLSSTAKYNSCTSFSKLLEFVSSTKFHEVNSQRSKPTENLRDAYGQSIGMKHDNATESLTKSNVTQGTLDESIIPSSCFLKNKDESDMNRPSFQTAVSAGHAAVTPQTIASQVHPQKQSNHMQQRFFSISGQTQDLVQKERGLDLGDHKDAVRSETNEISSAPIKLKSSGKGKEKKDNFDWDSLRIKAQAKAGKRERTENTMDSLDWDAVRCADVREIADTIKERGMNNRLAERIKDFLNRLIEEHGSIDLEWLRDVPPDQAKEYLLSVKGLGLKSVECVRLLTLHHLAFPVDTNVGRIAVRLGWVPLQPLPESLQLHLLELYPVLESIQKYLWPRLCKLDQKTLYELHYQMITFGKVFCTKSKPNCNACPMRGECRHFASAFASARLALPGPEQRSIVSTAGNSVTDQNPSVITSQLRLSLPENTNHVEEIPQTEVSRQLQPQSEINLCQPIIEEPKTPEPECSQVSQSDMEDAFYEDSGEIPTIKLDIQEFTLNLQNYMQENMELQEGEMSKALVALNTEAASIPMPKLKNVSRLRTEHCVYELPDTHPLLEGWDTREPDDPGRYLLAIWTPGETANSIQPPESKCSSHEECGQLCNEKECFSCNSFREANSQIVRGTLLIPCRTAMRGSFPLNGTYFQVNEVFADHVSSLDPISVPRSWIWNLNRRTVYFGTSIPTIFKGLSTQEIQQCFWRGYVCVRGFDRKTRAPRPLMARLHFPASKLAKTKEAKAKEKTRKDSSLGNAQGMEPNPERPELISNSNSLQGRGTA